jgi:hypothetical protein
LAVAVAEFIALQRAEFGVAHVVACRALGVSRAWFYKWRHGDSSRRRALAALVAALFAQHRGTYGAPRITADVRELGWRVSQNTIAAIMAEQGLKARTLRRRSGCWMPPSGGFTLQRVAPGEDGPLLRCARPLAYRESNFLYLHRVFRSR